MFRVPGSPAGIIDSLANFLPGALHNSKSLLLLVQPYQEALGSSRHVAGITCCLFAVSLTKEQIGRRVTMVPHQCCG